MTAIAPATNLRIKPQTPEALAPTGERITLDVQGMKCGGCVRAVEKRLAEYPGVVEATVNLVTAVAVVQTQPGQVQPQDLAQMLTTRGFPAQARQGDHRPNAPIGVHRPRWLNLAIALVLLALSLVGHVVGHGSTHDSMHDGSHGMFSPWNGLTSLVWLHHPLWHVALSSIALFGPGREILIDGVRALSHRSPNMNSLVSLGASTAYLASLSGLVWPQFGWQDFCDEPVMLVGFILLGRALEQRARNQAAATLQSLAALQPKLARLVGRTPTDLSPSTAADHPNPPEQLATPLEIPIQHVQVGEWLRVLPGDQIPVDGVIIAGTTTVDESMLSGEAMPVPKQVGDELTGGTLNQTGAVLLQATRTGAHTTLAQIIELVETAQARKAPIQRFADAVAAHFTYTLMAIAAGTYGFWQWLAPSLWPQWFQTLPHPGTLALKFAISTLVIACPCALGLATPTAILVGTSLGAKQGLLVRGGDILEQLQQVDIVVLDKTGTLTAGQPQVQAIWPQRPWNAQQLLQIAAAVESGSQHPLALAIQAAARLPNPHPDDHLVARLGVTDPQTEPGLGVSGWVQGEAWPQAQRVVVGTREWLQRHGVQISQGWMPGDSPSPSATQVFVGIGCEFAGSLEIVDPLRQDAQATVASLQTSHLQVRILSGDQHSVALATAQALGLEAEQVIAPVAPAAKAAAIAQLQAQGHRVAMLGDGINDAPALAQADVGLSFRSGTDIAVQTAGIILMRDRLGDLLTAFELSRATLSKVKQNLGWAFAYNLLGIPMAAGLLYQPLGLQLSPTGASVIMALSSVSVVGNSLLLARHRL
jgi:P-type Cu2+ transporter